MKIFIDGKEVANLSQVDLAIILFFMAQGMNPREIETLLVLEANLFPNPESPKELLELPENLN